MKTKYSVIPAAIAAIGLKIMSMFAVDGNGLLFGMNKSGINYFIIEIILGLFAVCVLINLFDRKTAPVYPVTQRLEAAICGFCPPRRLEGSGRQCSRRVSGLSGTVRKPRREPRQAGGKTERKGSV